MKKISIISLLQAEIIKFKKSPAFYLTLCAPVFLAIIMFLVYFFKADKLIKSSSTSMESYFMNAYSSLTILIPLFVILLNVLIFNVEYKSNTFKVLFSLPEKRSKIIIAKLVTAILVFILSGLLFQVSLFLGFAVNSFKYSDLFSFEWYTFAKYSMLLLQMLGVALLMLSLQFLFSFLWKNVVVAISIGFVGFISYIILIQGWQYIVYHPYAFPALALQGFKLENQMLSNQLLYSLIGTSMVFSLAIYIANRKQVVD